MPLPHRGYGVVLQPTVPTELLAYLHAYVSEKNGVRYLLAESVSAGHFFLEMSLVGEGDRSWRVQIPLHYVLLIGDVSDPDAGPRF